MAMPLPAVLALLGLMGSAVAWGFAGPAAHRRHAVPTVLLLAAGLASLPCGFAATTAHHRAIGMLVITAGVCLLALAAHLLRADAGRGPDEDAEPAGPPPVDWDAFDRERERWTRPRAGAR
ncbi:MAG TPA: hypothetical protein VII98_14275 [Solirubrobacteraceae bacterium]